VHCSQCFDIVDRKHAPRGGLGAVSGGALRNGTWRIVSAETDTAYLNR